MVNNKVLQLNDEYGFIDNYDMSPEEAKSYKPSVGLKGKVVITDDKGNVLLEKYNKIVLRGRTFALEKIFDLKHTEKIPMDATNQSGDGVIDSDKYGFNSKGRLSSKKVCLFKAGRGGTFGSGNVNKGGGGGDHFTVREVNSNATTMTEEIPFLISREGTEQDEGIKDVYFDLREKEEGSDVKAYFAKKITSISWGKSDAENTASPEDFDEVYVKLQLDIDKEDFIVEEYIDDGSDRPNKPEYTRNTFINEIALCIADNNMENIELFSKIHFPSEPLFNESKTLTIHYYVYA